MAVQGLDTNNPLRALFSQTKRGPKSYLQNAPYIVKARQANANKYAAYKQKYGVPVLTVISTSKGEIQNAKVLSQIRLLA